MLFNEIYHDNSSGADYLTYLRICSRNLQINYYYVYQVIKIFAIKIQFYSVDESGSLSLQKNNNNNRLWSNRTSSEFNSFFNILESGILIFARLTLESLDSKTPH